MAVSEYAEIKTIEQRDAWFKTLPPERQAKMRSGLTPEREAALLAPLRALHDVCARYGALLIVDEAHGLGVRGTGGRGEHAHHGGGAVQAAGGVP